MPLRDAQAVEFTPTGLSDAVDEVSAFEGACTSIANFVFDRVSRGAVVPRPGVQGIPFTSAGFTTPGVVSAAFMVGTRIYGMIGTADFAGKDRPFCYDIVGGAFIAVTNVSSALLPATQSTAGDWNPPSMDMIGEYVMVTHPGFTGTVTVVGWFDLTTPGTVKWNAGQTTTEPLPGVPQWVAQFFDRAYYFVGNHAISSDILNPLNITTAELADTLTVGDTTNVTGACGLPIGTATQGVLAALLVFKNKSIWQITGDVALNNLSMQELSGNVGTNAPRTLAATPDGVAFMASDGIRLVNLLAQTPYLNTDVFAPFTEAVNPSRTAACYANSVYRISVNTSFKQSAVTFNDYWYDGLTQRWNGPHSFPFNVLTTDGTTMYGACDAQPGFLFISQVAPLPSSVYTDNLVAYNCSYKSCNIDRPNASVVKQFVESTIELSASAVQSSYLVQLANQLGVPLNSVPISVQNPGSVWGTFVWGADPWQATVVTSARYGVPWTEPIVYEKLQLTVTVAANASVATKRFMMRVSPTTHMSLTF